MSPELHSPTVTVLSPPKLYNRKMKLYTFVCLKSCQMILLMNKTTHSSYFTEIIISSRFKECCLFVTLQILSSVTEVLSIKRRSINIRHACLIVWTRVRWYEMSYRRLEQKCMFANSKTKCPLFSVTSHLHNEKPKQLYASPSLWVHKLYFMPI